MSRLFYHVMQDNVGNLLFDVSGTMRLAGTGTLATIYGDEELTVILPNPMTNHPSYGSFKCYLGAGDYDFYMAKSGYTFETLTGVQGHGTMAQQDADAVAITGGSAVLDGPLQAMGKLAVQTTVFAQNAATIAQARDQSQNGLNIRALVNDIGGYALLFNNVAGAEVGSIFCNATTTAYGTSSDARLKKDVHPLTGALDVVRALKPVAFRWKSDESPGRGFIASEVADIVDGVITGERDAVEEDGSIRPQMIDHSKLVVYLVGACKELAAQVEALTARLEACGG